SPKFHPFKFHPKNNVWCLCPHLATSAKNGDNIDNCSSTHASSASAELAKRLERKLT
ncbi:unnamed protein product, partial [marine sediment metagenome]